ncbi:MAG: nucleoside monophosphate kinase [Acidobacteriota bacterium]|nr:nucleoside monophosphate kinase [Acidobacteriota bacterium]
MRILIFGPNGSGKGTQSAHLVKHFGLAHVESGGIFRANIKGGTELGKKAKAYIDQGELVPDSITIPMVIDRLQQDDCAKGWILDGFPRTPAQSEALIDALQVADSPLDVVITIDLDRGICADRLMGRRTCPNGHPNNTAIDAIAPKEVDGKLVCWKCGAEVTVRSDDVDMGAIDQRHDIYFDEEGGTLGGVAVVEKWAADKGNVKVIHVDGAGDIESIRGNIMSQLN